MRSVSVAFTLPTPSVTAVCALQTVLAGANLLINGDSSSGGSVAFSVINGLRLNVTSTGNLSNVNFTVTGFDENQNPQTESIVGPLNNTVLGQKFWTKISSISVNNDVATTVSVGFVGYAASRWVVMDRKKAGFLASVAWNLTGQTQVTNRMTFNDVLGGKAPVWQNTATVNANANTVETLTTPCGALSFLVSYQPGATAEVLVNQGSGN